MGYGLVESGVVVSGAGSVERLRHRRSTAPSIPLPIPPSPRRLPQLYKGLMELIAEYKPEAFAIEELFFNKNVRTALVGGPCSGHRDSGRRPRGPHAWENTPLSRSSRPSSATAGPPKSRCRRWSKLLLNMDHIPSPTTPPTPWQSQSATSIRGRMRNE